jgi:protein subunit release factor A
MRRRLSKCNVLDLVVDDIQQLQACRVKRRKLAEMQGRDEKLELSFRVSVSDSQKRIHKLTKQTKTVQLPNDENRNQQSEIELNPLVQKHD